MRDDHQDQTIVQRTDPLIGSVVANRFRIREKIASGGFGAIYRAEHMASGHQVAVKVLHPQLAADPNVIERFRREGKTLSKLRAPHTVTTYEFGEAPDGMLYIVMELLKGESLHERLRDRHSMPWREALQIARAICISLAEAHALGIVHRDLKPANIHLEARDNTDYVKVLDFGIAKIKRGSTTEEQPELTNAGQMIGTIDYMSPEQILGGQPDGRSDIFTLGILLFEMISGRRPFAESATPTSILAALLTQVAPKLSSFIPVPAALDAIVAKCLSREAADRFADVQELSEAIDRVLMTSSDDGATRTIAIGVHTQKWEDEEATVMADAHSDVRQSSPPRNTLESPAPPAPSPPMRTKQLTPAPVARTPMPVTRTPKPTPFPPYPLQQQQPPQPRPMPMPPEQQWQPPAPVINPSANIPVDNSGWNVPKAGRPSQVDPAAWQAYAGNANQVPAVPGRVSQPFLPPVAPSFPVADRNDRSGALTPQQLKTYDPNRDAAVGRVVWIVAIVLVVGILFALYQIVS